MLAFCFFFAESPDLDYFFAVLPFFGCSFLSRSLWVHLKNYPVPPVGKVFWAVFFFLIGSPESGDFAVFVFPCR